MITTIIFDLDDTLYDEIQYCKSGFAAAANFLTARFPQHPARQIFNALWTQFTAGNHTKTFNTALDELAITCDDKLIAELINTYRTHEPKITLPAESEHILQTLSQKYTLGLLTDGFLPAQQLKVKALGLKKYFAQIVYTEQLGREFWKPSPAGFEKLIDGLKVKPENMVYIGDNAKKDFIAPNMLGMTTIQLSRPAGIHPTPAPDAEASAKHKIKSLTELPDLLKKL